jgi:tRNA (guanine-N7-)-methyltransferase
MMAAPTLNFKRQRVILMPASQQHTASPEVTSNQQFCHEKLAQLVRRHLNAGHQRPPAAHTRAAFDSIRQTVEQRGKPLVFDSFCGTGMSTAALAHRHPGCTIVGIDKSAHRLAKHGSPDSSAYLLVQADCGDFWRLAMAAGWRLEHHYLLYPNPWPKSGQLQRRIHGSADLAALLVLGGAVELRTNWHIYAEEFGTALALCGNYPHIALMEPHTPISLFERKYLLSGHQLWRCRCMLVHNTTSKTRPPGGS